MDKTLLEMISSYSEEDKLMIKKAYEYAAIAHQNQLRQSGEPYIIHPLNVAYILAEMSADADTICAGLLHDVIEDTNITKEEIKNEFNEDIANLVDGVTKLSKINFNSKAELNMANTRKIITSITSDVRIIIIKLADRLHNMRTLEHKTEFKQKENSMETLEIFVPLAYYIGNYRIKNELEDLALSYIDNKMYQKIQEKKLILEVNNKECLIQMLNNINNILKDEHIPNDIKLRTKNIYGIYKNIMKGNKLSDIHDLFALKIMVNDINDCYKSLGLVHKTYHPINSKFKDYICNPKTNMYQSLHTTVFAPNDILVQTQIRTFDMDKIASFGLSSYWDINRGNARKIMQDDLKNKYQFYESLTEIDQMFSDDKEFISQIKKELLTDKIYVYTSVGETIELPKGSTIIDFAYKVEDDKANTMVAAKVNDEYKSIDQQLENKDRVSIVSDDLSYGPKKDWINKAVTTKAKRLIKECI